MSNPNADGKCNYCGALVRQGRAVAVDEAQLARLQAVTDAAAAREEKLLALAKEAIDDIMYFGSQVDEYFQDKWDLKGTVATHEAALAALAPSTAKGKE